MSKSHKVAIKEAIGGYVVKKHDGEIVLTKPRPNDRVADTCFNCAERGRVISPLVECFKFGGLGGSSRTCNDHMKRVNVTDCPVCGGKASFVEMASNLSEPLGIGYYFCHSKSCEWNSGKEDLELIPPKGVNQ